MSLQSDLDRAELSESPSCLMCRHFQYRKHATIMICTWRGGVRDIAPGRWTGVHARTARRRANDCEKFDDLREG